MRDETMLAGLVVVGGIVYAATILALFGRGWLGSFRAGPRTGTVE
jgi:hypothetical protein